MFIVRFTSGLGNQMFQYSFCEYLKNRYKDARVLADLTWFYAYNDHHGYELHRIFSKVKGSLFSLDEAGSLDIFKVTGTLPNICKPEDMITGDIKKKGCSPEKSALFEKFRRYPNRILREIYKKKQSENIIDQLNGNKCNYDVVKNGTDVYNELYEFIDSMDEKDDRYFTGFWIEERYYLPVLDKLRRSFVFPKLDEKNEKLSRRMMNENSVSIHVRRGDYLREYADSFKALSREYYEVAVDKLSGSAGISRDKMSFYIFSDDPLYMEREFSWLDNKTVVSGNEGNDSYKDMQLMSLCRHNIIANSTFSQWAALLNKNEGHITIYPKAYLRDKDNEIKT
ncbi:MAG: alpha-1,2-fucosyltransferase, partial [Lachnospiraceae bacterium]|nr:alpha-1,2-fucosyltransferase [Lachnospiraceae bacterium]